MKKLLLIIVVLLIFIQFFKPEKNSSNKKLIAIENVPVEVEKLITKSCADCHSNNTNYPWYSNIAPISWYLASHVNEGKEHLNFSEWNNYNKYQKEHIINDLEEVIETHEMPLKSYLLLHKEATLTNAEYKALLNWVNTLNME